ncbi:MAG: aminoglycoside phosphotransferase family protein [SAR202 cluster bacterium]|nr:aminoglycoside phosphotransferase family protein [SAR202 cluster bacterium]
MLEKPDIQDESIVACLLDEYGLNVVQITFLPLGADRNTAVYRATTDDATPYFVKLRLDNFDETSVALPRFLSDLGIGQVMAPLATKTGQLSASLNAFRLILYPFVEGRNGYEVDLSDHHWVEFGAALKGIHTAEIPAALVRRIQREAYSSQWRETTKISLDRAESKIFDDPVSTKLAAFLKSKRDEILDLVERAEGLAQALRVRSLEFIVCHSDLHAGNILIDANDAFYIVDWDDPVLAPKERDLMFVGGGLVGTGHTPQEEESLFYQGYGQAQIDPVALAYYRYERIIQDIAEFCEQIFSTDEGGADREQSLRYLASSFRPGGVLKLAYKSDKTSKKR